jgi:hypothetical protein
LSAVPLFAWQGTTPQAALEELATATKPEAITRHLPEPVQKGIEVLPKLQKQLVMDQFLEMKKTQFNECSIRPAQDSEGWEILDEDNNSKGKVRLANASSQALMRCSRWNLNSPATPRISSSPCILKTMSGASTTLAHGRRMIWAWPSCCIGPLKWNRMKQPQ